MKNVKYVVETVHSRSAQVVFDENMYNKWQTAYVDDDREEDLDRINTMKRYNFAKPQDRLLDIYNEIRKKFFWKLEPFISLNENVIHLSALQKMNGVGANYGDLYLWQDGQMELQITHYKFFITKLIESDEFDVKQQLMGEGYGG